MERVGNFGLFNYIWDFWGNCFYIMNVIIIYNYCL